MVPPRITYPALYQAASNASASAQTTYLRLIKGEYALLIIAAILSMNLSNSPLYHAFYALVFFFSLLVLLSRSLMKPEQSWYKSRALAESIKTSTWRYVMRAGPFDDAEDVTVPKGNFRNTLKSILDANKNIGERVIGKSSPDHQITSEMNAIRSSSLVDRIKFYDENRVRDQREWYARKAGSNKKSFNLWLLISVTTYVVAAGLAIFRIVYADWPIWPIEPLIVAASATIGWIQVKKFSELAASYTLTAHEISIIQGRINEIESEEKFSEFVNEAELAFSREHTQWVARQQQ